MEQVSKILYTSTSIKQSSKNQEAKQDFTFFKVKL